MGLQGGPWHREVRKKHSLSAASDESDFMKKRKVIIIGGGPGGAATALYLIKSGIRPVIVERQSFPRFHIGESLSGECGNSVRKLDLETELKAQNYPVKHGVNVYNPKGVPFWVEVKGALPGKQRLDSEFDLVSHAEQLR